MTGKWVASLTLCAAAFFCARTLPGQLTAHSLNPDRVQSRFCGQKLVVAQAARIVKERKLRAETANAAPLYIGAFEPATWGTISRTEFVSYAGERLRLHPGRAPPLL